MFGLMQEALMKASDGGKLPIVCDTSPCLSTLKGALQGSDLKCEHPSLEPPWNRDSTSARCCAMAVTKCICPPNGLTRALLAAAAF